LKADGLRPWLDEEDLLPGDEWEDVIRKAVRASDVVVVCLSKNSTKSGFVHKEIGFALDEADKKPEGKRYLIPAILEPCEVPERLRKWHWVDLSTESGYNKLLKALRGRQELESSLNRAEVEPVLLISDGTAFASELGTIFLGAGFPTLSVTHAFLGLPLEQSRILLEGRRVIVLVRGEHFRDWANEEFYTLVRDFVTSGGILLATAWVSWENRGHRILDPILPFEHVHAEYEEDTIVDCQVITRLGFEPFGLETIQFRGSLEHLRPRVGSTVLLLHCSSIPIFGFREIASGCCYYLNVCQHSCYRPVRSPLESSRDLRLYVESAVKWLWSKHMKV